MKNIKKITAIVLAFALVFALAACGKSEEQTTTGPYTASAESTTSDEREVKTKVAALKGPTGMGIAELKEHRGFGYEVEYYSDPTHVPPLLINGEVDIAALPLNLAANLYKKTNGGIQMLAINTLGVMYVLEKGDSIKSVKDLKNKTVYTSGEGTTAQYITEYVLSENGIDAETGIDLQYKSTHNEVAALATDGSADIMILPEPFATIVLSQNEDYRRALSFTDEWNKVSDAELAQGCIVARTEYIEENPDLIEEFMGYYEVSVNFANNEDNMYSAAEIFVNQGFFTDSNVAAASIASCNMVFIDGEEMKKIADANFKVLFSADPTSIGGEVPDEGIYYLG